MLAYSHTNLSPHEIRKCPIQAISELRLALHGSHFVITREPPSTLTSLRRRTAPYPNPSNQSGRESGKMKKTIPTYEEAKDELGEDAMSFFMDMVRQDNAPPDKEEIPPPATDENKGLSKP